MFLYSEAEIKFKHQLLLIFGMVIPLLILNVLAYISNYPTLENEHLTNYELAKTLEFSLIHPNYMLISVIPRYVGKPP